MEKISIGTLYGRAAEAVGQSAGALAAIMGLFLMLGLVVIFGTTLVFGFSVASVIGTEEALGAGWSFGIILIVLAFLAGYAAIATLAQASAISVLLERMNGRSQSISAAVQTAFSSLLPLVGIGILVTILPWIGLLFLIVPGVFLWLAWSVAVPAQVDERRGVGASLARSWRLTSGNRGRLFLAWLGMLLILYAVQFAIGAMFESLPLLVLLINLVMGTLWVAASAGLSAAAYLELRRVKGEATGDELEAIFA